MLNLSFRWPSALKSTFLIAFFVLASFKPASGSEGPSCGQLMGRRATVPLNSPEGQARLARSLNPKLLTLMNQFEPQRNKFYCGIASGVIVLNALYVKNPIRTLPVDHSQVGFATDHLPADFVPVFSRFTQTSFLDPLKEGRIKSMAAVHGRAQDGSANLRDSGLQLRELSTLMEAHGVEVDMHILEPSAPLLSSRLRLIEALSAPSTFVIVNFDRSQLGQRGAGHISPLGAYDPGSDSVLVVDVNPTFAEWTWVDLDALIRAMGTRDLTENRGFLIVKGRPE